MELNFKSYGQGDPIIILHGMFGMLDNWQMIAKKLAEDYMVFIVDLRNHGRSPHSDEFGYEIMAEDLYQFMNDNWLHHAHLIGHSMGGKVVMKFALEYEDMVDKLMVVDMAPKTYQGNHGTILSALAEMPVASITSRTEAQNFLQARIPEQGVVQFLLKNLSRNLEDGGYKWKMNLPVITAHYQEILSHKSSDMQFDGPTLFVKGANSNYITTEEFPDYLNNFPNATLDIIEDAGHWVHAEKPKAFLTSIRNFITKE